MFGRVIAEPPLRFHQTVDVTHKRGKPLAPLSAEFPVLEIVDRTGQTVYLPVVCDEGFATQIGLVLKQSGKFKDVSLITKIEMDLGKIRENLRR